ncbi:MAG: NAD-dependent epimerase/dehydratase family protein [Planctomycetota bacterium]|nr:MAG: NAD-dependent epimerase/dehydratase family protein [Planctomycetota bacterium]
MSAAQTGCRFLVTGGAGFIGSHLCESLIESGGHITVVDDLSTGRRSNLDAARMFGTNQLELIESTVSGALPSLAARRFDGIYHLAAAVGVRLVLDDPARAVETNIFETAAILSFAARTRTPLLFASSSEVYGKGVRAPFKEDDDLVFGAPTVSRWSYGLSKAIDEQLALAHAQRDGLPVVIARFFNTVGPRQRGRYGMVLPRFVAAAVTGAPLQVHGSGRQVRCFCDVRDVAAALPRLLDHAACHGRVFNVGGDRPVTVEDLAALVIRVTGSTSVIEHVPYAEVFGSAFEDLAIRVPDISRIRAEIGFEARISLERTIADLVTEHARTPEATA